MGREAGGSVVWHAERQAPQPALDRPLLPLLRLELDFRFDDAAWLPPLRGALWRSALGLDLKRLEEHGHWPVPAGGSLGLNPQSMWRWVYKTGVDDALAAPSFGQPPHPLVIDAPPEPDWQILPPGTVTRFQISVFGRMTHAFRPLVDAFRRAGERGLGRAITREGRRGRASLIAVHQVWRSEGEPSRPLWTAAKGWLTEQVEPDWPQAPDAAPLRVHFATPLRLEEAGRPVKAGQLTPARLFPSLARRISALMASETGARLDLDFQTLKEVWQSLEFSASQLHWLDLARWSSSQQAEVPAGGIVGWVDLDLTGCQPLFDLLWLSQWTHVGKGTLMGLGSIRLAQKENRS